MAENILILGNGFDLAMGRKTSYTDFLEFLDNFKIFLEYSIYDDVRSKGANSKMRILVTSQRKLQNLNLRYDLKMDIIVDLLYPMSDTKFKNTKWNEINKNEQDKTFRYFYNLKNNNNLLYKYITDGENKLGENWSHLEQRISDLANALSDIKQNIDKYDNDFKNGVFPKDNDFSHKENKLAYELLITEIIQNDSKDKPTLVTIDGVNQKLAEDLDELTDWLEFYLTYLDRIEVKLLEKNDDIVLNELDNISESKVINFNYTETIKKFGVVEDNIHFIHGRLNFSRNRYPFVNQMVFGIEDKEDSINGKEDETVNINADLIPYQKFYQRVVKETGNSYIKYFKESGEKNIIVFGHSVDPLDKEIFRTCFDLSENGKFNYRFIFAYYNEDQKWSVAKNLAIILGKNKFIELSDKGRIIFIKTDDRNRMKKILSESIT